MDAPDAHELAGFYARLLDWELDGLSVTRSAAAGSC
jgi:hypothetical protein